MDLIHALQLGRVPRVVGTIITAEYLRNWSANPTPLPCDLVELRLDGFSDFPDWLKVGTQIEHQGTPVIVTIRLKREGGLWTAGDADRWPLLEDAIRHLSGVDVELSSNLVSGVSELAGQLGKLRCSPITILRPALPSRNLRPCSAARIDGAASGKSP